MGEDSEMKRTHTPQDIEKIQNRWKKLTDEEINKLYMEYGNKDWDWQIDFARAILKKASEK
jgi:C1A family cysteine protease